MSDGKHTFFGEFRPDEMAPMQKRLASVLSDCAAKSSVHQRAWLGAVFSRILDALAPNLSYPETPIDQQAFALVLAILGERRNPALLADPNPVWLEPSLLAQLQAESRRWLSVSRDSVMHQVYVRSSTAICESLSLNQGLLRWCEEGLGVRLRPTGRVNYIHYYGDQQRCTIHADNPEHYEYNCLIGLLHEAPEQQPPSVLRIFEPDSITDIQITPGSAVIFHSSATPHGRTPLAPQEKISLLSVGFQPTDLRDLDAGLSPSRGCAPIDPTDSTCEK
jgi:hypothetical protein